MLVSGSLFLEQYHSVIEYVCLTVHHPNEIHIQRRQVRFGRFLFILHDQFAFFRDTRVGKDVIDASLLVVDFFERAGLALPRGDVALMETETGGGDFFSQCGQGLFACGGVDV